jgi:hypothetical protein
MRDDNLALTTSSLKVSRQKRFQTVFHGPNSFGSARQVMLWTEK